MPSHQEIIQQAIDQCAEIDARYTDLRVEIQRQRRAALETVPHAAAAYLAWEKALESARDACDKKLQALATKTRNAEAEAPAAQAAAESAALEAWHADRRKADATRDREVAKAMDAYGKAFDLAMKATGPAHDVKIADARRKRDAALAEAAGDHQRDVDAADADYQAATLKAQNNAIEAVSEARQIEAAKGAETEVARNAAMRSADESLEAALAAAPVAGAILEAFADRLQRAELARDDEKAAVTARMKQLLADATIPPPE